MAAKIEQVIEQAAGEFIKRITGLGDDPYLQEAIAKIAIRSVTWHMYDYIGDQHTIADILEEMAGALVEHNKADKKQRAG